MKRSRELEIIKAALERDISLQREGENAEKYEWKLWLLDSEKVLKKVNKKLSEAKVAEYLIEETRNNA